MKINVCFTLSYILFRNIQKFYFLFYDALILSDDIQTSCNIESVADVQPPGDKTEFQERRMSIWGIIFLSLLEKYVIRGNQVVYFKFSAYWTLGLVGLTGRLQPQYLEISSNILTREVEPRQYLTQNYFNIWCSDEARRMTDLTDREVWLGVHHKSRGWLRRLLTLPVSLQQNFPVRPRHPRHRRPQPSAGVGQGTAREAHPFPGSEVHNSFLRL